MRHCKNVNDCDIAANGQNLGYQTFETTADFFFLQKDACALWPNIVQVLFLCNVVSDVFQQHRLDNIIKQCCAGLVNTMLYRLYSSQTLAVSHGPTLHR